MSKVSQNLVRKVRRENSQDEKVSSLREIISQLKEVVGNLITLSGFPKGQIANDLDVTPSTISAWLDRTGQNTRPISIEDARSLVKLVKPQPRKILENIERDENGDCYWARKKKEQESQCQGCGGWNDKVSLNENGLCWWCLNRDHEAPNGLL